MRFFRFQPRYGLRTLFGLTLLCALGAAWWTRPYQAPRSEAVGDVGWCFCGTPGFDEIVYGRDYRVTDTMRRSLWGGPVRHGPSMLHDTDGRLRECWDWRHGQLDGLVQKWNAEGQLLVHEEWRDGRQHGLSREWDDKGELQKEAEYRDDECVRETLFIGSDWLRVTEYAAPPGAHSVQTTWNGDKSIRREVIRDWKTHLEAEGWHDNGQRRYVGQWVDGLIDGEWVVWDEDGQVRDRFEYREGRLIIVNGRPVAGLALPESPTWAEERIAAALNSSTALWLELLESPLAELTEYIEGYGNIIFRVDKRALRAARIDDDVTLSIERCDLPLSAALHMLLEPHGLTCAVRYEQLWITTPGSKLLTGDTTGVDDIVPPPGSRLAKEWENRTVVQSFETPLAELATLDIAERHRIEIKLADEIRDAAENSERYWVTAEMRGIQLKSAIGALLYEFNLRCRLEGETLVIYGRDAHKREMP